MLSDDLTVDVLANEIRRVDGDSENRLGAGALAEALMPRIAQALAAEREAERWRDIETDPPPKDGSMVLLYNEPHDEQAVMGWTADVGMPEVFPDGCWTDVGNRNAGISLTVNGGYFQFWQPLLSPPAIRNRSTP